MASTRHSFFTDHINLIVFAHTSATLQQVSIHTTGSRNEQRQFNRNVTRQLAQSEAAYAILLDKIEESSATQRELNRMLGEFRVGRVNSAIDQTAATSTGTTLTTYDDIEASPRMRSKMELQMQTVRPLRTCAPACPCDCHKVRRFRMPSKMSLLFGHGSIGLKGLPFWRPDCNHRHCRQGTGLSIVVNYFLPMWLSQAMLSAWFSSAPLCPPEFLIRMYEVREFYGHPLFEAMKPKDQGKALENLRTTLAKGSISPYIINEGGLSLLHVCQTIS